MGPTVSNPISAKTRSAGIEAVQIRALLNDWIDAHRVKDAERIMSLCAEDVVQFIMAPPLEFKGVGAWDWKAWFASFEGPIKLEFHDVKIATGGDTAFCHFLSRLSAKSLQYGEFGMWNRTTMGFRRVDERWQVTHAHSSVPFYMDGSFRAAVDLQP